MSKLTFTVADRLSPENRPVSIEGLPPEVHDRLVDLAVEQGVSLGVIVTAALIAYTDDIPDSQAIYRRLAVDVLRTDLSLQEIVDLATPE